MFQDYILQYWSHTNLHQGHELSTKCAQQYRESFLKLRQQYVQQG